jgi:ABC-type amino acid transport substrate-binding protein
MKMHKYIEEDTNMKKISRRSFLAVAGAAAAAGLLSACGASSSTAASSAAASSAAASSTAASSSAAANASDPAAFLADKKIGVQLGTTGDLYISGDIDGGSLGKASVEEYNKGADAVQALLNGQIDAVVIDDQVAQKFVDINSDKLAILDTAYTTEDYAICFKKDSEMTAKFNEAIAALKDNGTLDAILKKYIENDETAKGYVSDKTSYANGKLIMATNAEFEPYEYKESNTIVGIDAEFGKAICDYLDYDMEIEDIAFDSIIPEVTTGKADFGMAGMTITEDRLKNVDFTDSYCTGVQVIIYKK